MSIILQKTQQQSQQIEPRILLQTARGQSIRSPEQRHTQSGRRGTRDAGRDHEGQSSFARAWWEPFELCTVCIGGAQKAGPRKKKLTLSSWSFVVSLGDVEHHAFGGAVLHTLSLFACFAGGEKNTVQVGLIRADGTAEKAKRLQCARYALLHFRQPRTEPNNQRQTGLGTQPHGQAGPQQHQTNPHDKETQHLGDPPIIVPRPAPLETQHIAIELLKHRSRVPQEGSDETKTALGRRQRRHWATSPCL